MAEYTTVDEVAARFPQFRRSGAFQVLGAASRTGNVATFTTALAHGYAAGWNAVIQGVTAAGTTDFDGTFAILAVPSPTTFTVQQIQANDTGAGGTASGAAPNSISDGQIQNWIDEKADLLEAVALSRGYNLSGLTPDAATILGNINKLMAQVMLGEAIWAGMGQTGDWKLLESVREELTGKDGKSGLLGAFHRGAFDKNFLGAAAKTQDAGPQMGGYVPGNLYEPDNAYSATPPLGATIFRKEKQL